MTQARRFPARRDGESSVDEDTVERCHTRLASLVHGCERDVFRPLQVSHDLACVQTAFRLDDPSQMRVGTRERAIEERIELVNFRVGLEHGCALDDIQGAPIAQ